MNWELYEGQDLNGRLYMLGIEQIINGLDVSNTISTLQSNLRERPFDVLIPEYIATLEYCRRDL